MMESLSIFTAEQLSKLPICYHYINFIDLSKAHIAGAGKITAVKYGAAGCSPEASTKPITKTLAGYE